MTTPPFNNLLSEADAIDAKIAAWRIQCENQANYERDHLRKLITQATKVSTHIRVYYSQNSQTYAQ